MSKHKVEIDVSLNMDGISKDFNELEKKAKSGTKAAVSAVSQLTSAMEDTGGATRQAGQDFEKTADDMKKSSKEAAEEVKGLKQSVDGAKNSTEGLKESEEELGRQSRETGNDQEGLGDKTEETRQKVEQSRETFISWGEAAKTAVKGTMVIAGTLLTSMGAVVGISAKFGTEYQQASNTVQASTGATAEEMKGLQEVMKNVYAGNFGEDMNEVAEAVANVKKNIGGTDQEIQKATEAAFGFRDTFGYDIPESTRAASMLMKTFGTDAEHAYDLMAKGAQKGLDFSGEMLDSITEYAPQFAKAGLSAEQMFNIMASGYEAGAWNLDKVGDAVKELNIRLVDGSNTTAEGLKMIGLNADEVAKKMSQGGEVATETYKQVVKGLAEMDDKQAQNIAGVNLFGTMWEDLGPAVVEQLAVMEGAYDDVKGTMEEINKVKYDDAGSALEALKRKAEVSLLLPISQNIMPAISGATEAAIGYIDELANAYESEGVNGLIKEAGEIFADIATNAAEQAPEMVKVAVSFIDNTIKGFQANKGRLSEAGKELTKTLCSAVAQLLPKELQEPVEDAMDDLIDSITGGGIRNGIKTFSNIFKNGFEVVTKVTKTVLPPFVKAIDKVADNLDVLIPLATAGAAAFKGYKVVDSVTKSVKASAKAVEFLAEAEKKGTVAQVAATGAIKAKDVAVALLTGKIKLATVATTAWNTVLTAAGGPIGLVVAGVSAVTAGIAAYCLVADEGKTSQEMLNESLEKAGGSFQTVGNAAAEFTEGIKNAGSIFDGFNDSIIVSNEVQQECASQMDAVQSEITQIARTATEERRGLTETEIQRLDELFSKMRELTAQELAIQKAYATAVRDSAKSLADTYDGNAQEYAEASQVIINSAYETKDSVVSKAYEQMLETNAINQQLVGTAEQYTQEWYENEAAAAQERYQQAIESATKECGDTLSIIQQGYADRATAGMEYLTKIGEVNSQAEQEKQRHEDRLRELEEEHAKHADETRTLREAADATYHANVAKENKEHEATLAGIWDSITANMSSEQMEQAGVWLAMITQTAMSGGELSAEAKNTAGNFIEALSQMPEETREKFESVVEGAFKGLENFDEIQKRAEEEGKSFLDVLREVLQVNSPSKAVKEIFSAVNEGAEAGLDEGKEGVLEKGRGLVTDFLQTLSGEELKEGGRQAGLSATSSMSQGITEGQEGLYQSSVNASQYAKTGLGSVQATDTGNIFLMQYQSGMLSMQGAANVTARNIATTAKAAMAAIKAIVTGTEFGNQYVSGLNSKTGNARAAGNTVATAARMAMAAIKAIATGTEFGGQYITGLNSKQGSSRSAGNTIATVTRAAMAAIIATATGSTFGGQYITGINSKKGASKTEGTNLAKGADSGAKSVDGSSAGSGFGSGFVSGINSWIGSAVSAAANLAASALAAAKRAIDSRSPAKKTRKVGHDFDDGFVLGIEDGTKDAVKAAGNYTRRAAEAMEIPDFSFGMDYEEIKDAMRAVDDVVLRQGEYFARTTFTIGSETYGRNQSNRFWEREAKIIGKAVADVVNDRMEEFKFTFKDRELGRVVREVLK